MSVANKVIYNSYSSNSISTNSHSNKLFISAARDASPNSGSGPDAFSQSVTIYCIWGRNEAIFSVALSSLHHYFSGEKENKL